MDRYQLWPFLFLGISVLIVIGAYYDYKRGLAKRAKKRAVLELNSTQIIQNKVKKERKSEGGNSEVY